MSKYSAIKHLSKEDIVKNGSIFTPSHISKIVKKMCEPYIDKEAFVMDMGSGYGAFISEFEKLGKMIIGTEYDGDSYQLLIQEFPNIIFFQENSLLNISRKKYGIKPDDSLVIVGNPPYNDITSQYKKGKKGSLECDSDVASRDFGISFLKTYNKLKADTICVLHPLAYLIKKTNFSYLGEFSKNYKLEDAVIFSSKEFETIRKTNSDFPVVAALYRRNEAGMDFEYVKNFKFKILKSKKKFCLSKIETIDGKVNKYPSKVKTCDLQFYTLRDMNALLRNAGFVNKETKNGVDVSLEELYKYSWLLYLKENFAPTDLKFIYGNLSPLYSNKIELPKIKRELVSYAYNNSDLVRKCYSLKSIEDVYGSLQNKYPNIKKILSELYL